MAGLFAWISLTALSRTYFIKDQIVMYMQLGETSLLSCMHFHHTLIMNGTNIDICFQT